jgi:zinc/manganese transport system substrate-binding protein
MVHTTTLRARRRYRDAAATAGAVSAVALVVLTGCGADTQGSPADEPVAGAPIVVATTSIWADITRNVACGGIADVRTLIPIGGDPHSFEPSLRDRETLDRAALVVANGLQLEESLVDTIEAAEGDGTAVIRLGDLMATIALDPAAPDEDAADAAARADDDHERDGADPHVWMDPRRVAGVLDALGDALVADAGLDRAAVDTCIADYAAALDRTEAEMTATLSAVPDARRRLVTSHEALAYFAERFRFELIGAVIPAPSTLAETNAAALEQLATRIAAAGVPAIFAESQHSADDTEALAERIGDVEVVTLFTDSLGEPDTEADTYLGLLTTDARLIADALG